MKKLYTVLIFLVFLLLAATSSYAQDSTKTDGLNSEDLKALHKKEQAGYFKLKDELLRIEGRLQMLEYLISQEDKKLKEKTDKELK